MVPTGLRAGIVLLGFKLALCTAGHITGTALPVAAASNTGRSAGSLAALGLPAGERVLGKVNLFLSAASEFGAIGGHS